jgi:uncharacterized iron-regulated membrane protein
MTDTRVASRKWLVLLGAFLLVLLVAGGMFAWRARHMDNAIRLWVIRSLSDHFQSRVELATLRVTGFPHLGVVGEDLTIYFHDRTDVPPIIHIDKFSFDLGVLAILRLPRHVSMALIENMTVTIPPRGEKKKSEIKRLRKTEQHAHFSDRR